MFSDLQMVMRSEMEQIGDMDSFSQWRKKEIKQLSSIVESAILRLQNPTDCKKAKKIICNYSYETCGLGCLINHGAYCLITALATNRVAIMKDTPWFYSNITVQKFFAPLSATCLEADGKQSYHSNYLLICPITSKVIYNGFLPALNNIFQTI